MKNRFFMCNCKVPMRLQIFAEGDGAGAGEGGNQFDFMAKVIMPTMAVSGFFTPAMAESLMKNLDQADVIL